MASTRFTLGLVFEQAVSGCQVTLGDDSGSHGQDRGKVFGQELPVIAVIAAVKYVPRLCPDVNTARIEGIRCHALSQRVEEDILLREAVGQRLPAVAGVERAVDSESAVGHIPF